MRLSVLKDDPGYHPHAAGGALVFLNDAQVKRCFSADEERGVVVCADLDDAGRVRLNDRRTEVLKKTLHGRVRIELIAGSSLARSVGAV